MTDSNIVPQVNIPKGMIHLGIGQPGNDLLPVGKIRDAWQAALDTTDTFFLAYGEDKGNQNFRESLAGFLSRHYPENVDPDRLMITNGNSHALDLLCTRLTSPGDCVLVEEPSYFLAFKIFEDHGLNVIGVPMDSQGIITDDLAGIIEKEKPKFIYTIPIHHNPAGVTLAEDRRKKLVQLCKNHDVFLVADEVYHFLTFEGDTPTPMGTYCSQGPVICLGSFSKILAPGLRLGWIQADESIIQRFEKSGVVISGGGFNPFTSQMVDAFIRSGMLEDHIDRLNRIYKKRKQTLCQSFKKEFGPAISFEEPSGGYFVWVEFEKSVNANTLRQTANKELVDFYGGSLFSSQGGLSHCIRLAFSFYDEPQIEMGVRRLHQAFRQKK